MKPLSSSMTLLVLGVISTAPLAAPVCSSSDVQITTVTRSDGTPIPPLPAPINSAECTGPDSNGSPQAPAQGAGGNLGYNGDGLYNGAQQNGLQFPNGIFSDQYTAHDLNNDGVKATRALGTSTYRMTLSR